ncbi:MAG: anaerobic ribonucleoside-triphosphate reductase activating protein [Oscillospiraceae bacterium]|nr:anaerobic ribonucleoside-triphosphate reductase activating protein [Oscillospiraceae bacterium]
MKLRMSGVVGESIIDGPGIRYTVFVQGCPHHCEGCHNPQTHDFSGGYDDDTDAIFEKIIQDPLLDGVTFSGGEPFCQARPLALLGQKVKAKGLGVIAYTGYTLEYLLKNANEENGYMDLLETIDWLVDGRFVMALKSYECRFRGSTNQRIIDVLKTLEKFKEGLPEEDWAVVVDL